MTAARRRAAVGGGYGAEYFGIRSERSRRALSVRRGWGWESVGAWGAERREEAEGRSEPFPPSLSELIGK